MTATMIKSFAILLSLCGLGALILLVELLFLHISKIHYVLPGWISLEILGSSGLFSSIAAVLLALLGLRRQSKSRNSVLLLAYSTLLLLSYMVLVLLSNSYASLPPEMDNREPEVLDL